MRTLKVVLAIVMAFYYFDAVGQEQWGLRLGANSGIGGLALNPATGLNSEYNVDIWLVSGHGFLENNYAFLRRESIFGLAPHLSDPQLVASFNYDREPQSYPNAIVYDFDDDGRNRYPFGSAALTGPSLLFRLPGGHTLGWVVQGRFAISGQNVPNNLSYFRYDRRPDLVPFEVDRFEMGLLAWGEVGIHYGKQWEHTTGTNNIAIVAKYLQGWEGAYFENNTDLQAYTKITGDTIAAEKMDLNYGYTRTNLGAPPFIVPGNGSGFGFDLGFERTYDGYLSPYQWKWGVSLLDIGAMKFRRNAVKHRAVSSQNVVVPNVDYEFVTSPEDIDQVARMFSFHTLGDSSATLIGDDFTLWMPSAASFQLEFGLAKGFWLNAAAVQRIPHPGIAIQRGNALMIGGRYETRWFAAGLPITLYNLEALRIGAFARIGPLVIGSDNLSAYFIRGRLSGGDFYFALHWPFKGGGNGRSIDFFSGKKGKEPRCYSF
jgi:hypothetical protein